MKRSLFLLLFIALTCITTSFKAQAPNGINYQAVIRTNTGSISSNQPVVIRARILQSTATGTAVFSERHNLTTDQFGMVNFVIGNGVFLAGSPFANLNWANGPYFLELGVAFTNQTNPVVYMPYGTQQMMSVPYALYAKSSGNLVNQWSYGIGAPASNAGTVGDYYLDTATGNVYNKSNSTTWVLITNITGPQGPAGVAGPQGIQGVAGPIGPTGPAGVAGATGATGATGPIGATGPTGAAGPQGPAGTNGTAVLNGNTNPTAGTGVNGDFYINTATNTLFGPKANGTWPAGISLVGPQGPQGIQGLTGPTGPQGPAGLLTSGTAAGNTPYWNGSQWVVNGTNLYNNGSNLGVGTTTPHASALTDLTSTTQGFLPPRMTTVQRNAIASPAIGLVIYNTTVNCLQWWNGTVWYDGCGNNALPAASLTTLNCVSASTTGTLTSGQAASNVSVSVPYTGGNAGTYSAQSVASTGVTGLTATLAAGTLANGNGSVTYTITGTPASSGTATFAITLGGQSCNLTVSVAAPAASLTTLNCAGATTTGTLTSGQMASNVSVSVPYTGGNAGTYSAQSVASTGVTGLTATLAAGTLANGNGSVTYTITGTPASSGTATFAITLGGQSCNLTVNVTTLAQQYPANSVFCAAGATAIVDVLNPTTNKTWMDRNLGATQVAASSTDQNAYGDLYQWGRRTDGHQCRTSPTTGTLSSVDQPAHGSFILAPNAPYDWRSPQNANLWQGVNGVNNPCPSGYRLPTETELNNERLSWSSNNSAGAFASPLKWPLAGYRDYDTGSLSIVGASGLYWSSTVSGAYARYLNFGSSNAYMGDNRRAYGFSVRCLKD